MKEFKTVAFAGFEKQIRDARLTAAAMRGEVIGNFVAEAWFSTQRLVSISPVNTESPRSTERPVTSPPPCPHGVDSAPLTDGQRGFFIPGCARLIGDKLTNTSIGGVF